MMRSSNQWGDRQPANANDSDPILIVTLLAALLNAHILVELRSTRAFHNLCTNVIKL